MATLDWELATADDVTLVHAAVRSEVEESVRIVNELSGPVWPPRSQGRPVAGWTDGGYAGVTEPGSPLVVGYATPAPPDEPPVSLEAAPPPEDGLADATPDAVVRALGTAAPPRAAVPQISRVESHSTDDEHVESVTDQSCAAGAGPSAGAREAGPPAAVAAWLDTVAATADRAATGDGVDTGLATDRTALETVRERCGDILDSIDGLADPNARSERVR